jgi:hypothetical protein
MADSRIFSSVDERAQCNKMHVGSLKQFESFRYEGVGSVLPRRSTVQVRIEIPYGFYFHYLYRFHFVISTCL